jgi:metal-responsive CopG/Arc/MetJ family transcriptional regulator
MKATVTFSVESHLLDKIDDLKIKRGTNRSEAIRHTISEFFRPGSMNLADIVDEFARLKNQNRELKELVEKMMRTMDDYNGKLLAIGLLLGSNDKKFRSEMMRRYFELWEKPDDK